MPRPARFTIRAASALTGINQNTLRAWERRHGLIQPERTPKGYRLYTDEDIERLRMIQRAIQEGVSVGRVRTYLETDGVAERLMTGTTGAAATGGPPAGVALVEPRRATAKEPSPAAGRARDAALPLVSFALQIESAALRLDRATVERTFHRAVGLHSLRQAFEHALIPALARVAERTGDDGPSGCGTMLAAFAREKLLVALAGLRPLHQQPRALFAAAPGERADSSLMLVSLEVGLEGVSASYLGPAATADELVRTAEASGARVLALSATRSLPRDGLLALRDRLARLRRRPRLLVGGPAATREHAWLRESRIEALCVDPAEAKAQILQLLA